MKRLFDWIMPDKAYFGEKDYQQLVIIKELVRELNLPVEIIGCPIVREPNGLAMSSRNKRLSPEELQIAPNIYRILQGSLSQMHLSVEGMKKYVVDEIGKIRAFKLEYFEIANAETLQPVSSLDEANSIIGCIALYLGSVRLIDNIMIKK